MMKQNQPFAGCLFLFLHLLLFHFPSISSSSSSSNFLCHHDESSALLQFKSSFAIVPDYSCDKSLKTATWKNGSDCCSWNGVTCDTISGHVVGLNLGCEGIQGKLHPNNTLFYLTHLRTLDLSNNDFTYSNFHSKFGGFLSLKHLDMSWSNFEGEVPSQISHLSKLESLHLTRNDELVWKETTLKRFVQNATNLRDLFLDGTNMSSIRPNSIDLIFNQSSSLATLNLEQTGLSGNFNKSIFCLPNIQELDLSGNSFQGQFPKLSCSASLSILDLSSCGFEGPIFPSLSNLTHLNSLTLEFNKINDSVLTFLTFPYLTFLDLSDNELSGQIPNDFNISNKFQKIDLSENKIGGVLPTSLSNLRQLIELDLSSNSFSGQIPDVFGGMTKLENLNLHSNNFEGQIPSSLFTLTQLVALDCSYNKIESPLPNKITGFQKLTDLSLKDNLLNGTIPSSLLSLPSLEHLDLSNNQLTGHIGAISSYSLRHLYLFRNKLQGNIPETIFNLTNPVELDLSSNNLSGVVNFHHFSKFQNLAFLSLSRNIQLSLAFKSNANYSFSELRELDLSSMNLTEFPTLSEKFQNLDTLDLSNNKLNGRVTNWLLETSRSLNLSQNFFTSIDQISRNIDKLNGLDLSFNLLESDISASICNLSSLQMLNLAHNKFSGIIPQCVANLTFLNVLDLQMNKFHGALPSIFSTGLVTLNLYDNQLEGNLPKSLSQCKNLNVLNLGNNELVDNFPYWLQSLQFLTMLILRDNKLHGPIVNPTFEHPFPSLIIFDISANNFSGPLPKAYLKNFKAMKNVTQVITKDGTSVSPYMQIIMSVRPYTTVQYYDSVTVTMKGTDMAMIKIPTILVSMDLSRNKFEGEIPNVIGELHDLIGLNLSYNRLTGHIPQSMGSLANLEWLDLSSNMLTSQIPAELTNLNFLAFLNLSNNHLVGEIPQGKQFSTFSNDSYEGNLDLCGFPLSKKCGPEPEQHHFPPSANNIWSEEKFGFGWKPVAIGYGCGFVFGIGIGYFVFLIGKPRWLVMLFGGQPKRRVRRRAREGRTNGPTQMVPMS